MIMKRLVSPLLLVLILAAFSLGWRTTPPTPPPPPNVLMYPVNMTLAANRLFVSDAYTGLHVYDVTDLSAPKKVIRIPLRENHGSAVKGDIVYTNEYDQVQAIRINSNDSYTVVARIGVRYRNVEGPLPGPDGSASYFSCACTNGSSFDPATGPGGGGSSYATFAVIDNELYRVDGFNLHVYDITDNEKPKSVSSVSIGWDVETLHPTENYLFIGGNRGMYIFDRVDPRHPKQIAQIQHARACDPVVVSGPTAYVTLRGNNGCGQAADELLCVNIKEPSQPKIIGVKPMTTPHGLAVKDSRLYVSHGESGYSLVNVSQPASPAVEATWPGATRDFIWTGTTLFVLEDDNVAIYDASNPKEPRLLSKVEPESTL